VDLDCAVEEGQQRRNEAFGEVKRRLDFCKSYFDEKPGLLLILDSYFTHCYSVVCRDLDKIMRVVF